MLGRRPELTGGGLIRSLGGWDEVKAHRRWQKEYMKGDERILGDSDYVDEILDAAKESLQRKYQLKTQGLDLDKVAERVAALLKLPVEAVWATGKHHKTVAARSLLCYWSVPKFAGSNLWDVYPIIDTVCNGQGGHRKARWAHLHN